MMGYRWKLDLFRCQIYAGSLICSTVEGKAAVSRATVCICPARARSWFIRRAADISATVSSYIGKFYLKVQRYGYSKYMTVAPDLGQMYAGSWVNEPGTAWTKHWSKFIDGNIVCQTDMRCGDTCQGWMSIEPNSRLTCGNWRWNLGRRCQMMIETGQQLWPELKEFSYRFCRATGCVFCDINCHWDVWG